MEESSLQEREQQRLRFIEVFGVAYQDNCDWDEKRNCFVQSHVHIAWNAWWWSYLDNKPKLPHKGTRVFLTY